MFNLRVHGQVVEIAMDKVETIDIFNQERGLTHAIRTFERFVVGIQFCILQQCM